MLKSLLKYKFKIGVVIILVFFLAAVRAFENVLFYDPFLDYFKDDFTNRPIPQLDIAKLSLHLSLRYAVNTLFSLAIIYTIFEKISLIKIAAALYVIFFVILMLLLYFAIAFDHDNKMLLFYIRRFLIQPLFVLIFVPGFYFHERAEKNNVT